MKLVSIDTETELFDEKINKYNYNVEIHHVFYCSSNGTAHFVAKPTPESLAHLQNEIDTADTVTFHHAKFDLPKLAKIGVLIPQAKVSCSLIGFALLQGPRSSNGLKPLAKKFLGMNMDDFDESLYSSLEEMDIYAKKDAIATRELYPILLEQLDRQGLLSLYQDVELPLIPALIDLESNGMKIELKALKTHCRELLQKQKERLKNLALKISPDFNPNSPTQIASYIHDTLGIKVIYHTKKGKRATDVKSLEKYNRHKQDETINEITAYLKDSKFLSNQAIPILKKCDPADGRLRCTYNPLGTETGRFTANNPNLQGVSKKGPLRSFFIAEEGHKLVCADFKQQEPRILAACTGDEKLLEIVAKGEDFYKYVASIVFSIPLNEVTDEIRAVAKVLTLSVIYGKGAPAVAEDLKISYLRAKKILKLFDSLFPKIVVWKNSIIDELIRKGYLTTPLGRRRDFDLTKDLSRPDVNSIEREAINFIIQGTAADASKITLKKIHDNLNPGWKLLAFIHDEYLLEVPDADIEEAKHMLQRVMSEKIDWLGINLVADIGHGSTWAEAKGK